MSNRPIVKTEGADVVTVDVTIDNGDTESQAVESQGTFVGFSTPAALTGTAMTFTVSSALAGTYNTAKTDSATISYTVTTSSYYVMQPAQTAGWKFFKLVSGSAEGAARTITLHFRKLA